MNCQLVFEEETAHLLLASIFWHVQSKQENTFCKEKKNQPVTGNCLASPRLVSEWAQQYAHCRQVVRSVNCSLSNDRWFYNDFVTIKKKNGYHNLWYIFVLRVASWKLVGWLLVGPCSFILIEFWGCSYHVTMVTMAIRLLWLASSFSFSLLTPLNPLWGLKTDHFILRMDWKVHLSIAITKCSIV